MQIESLHSDVVEILSNDAQTLANIAACVEANRLEVAVLNSPCPRIVIMGPLGDTLKTLANCPITAEHRHSRVRG